jgi:hypothetical protein
LQPLHEIVSVAPTGEVTKHWLVPDLAQARRMAAFLAERLAGRETVKLRFSFEVVTVYEVELDFHGARDGRRADRRS